MKIKQCVKNYLSDMRITIGIYYGSVALVFALIVIITKAVNEQQNVGMDFGINSFFLLFIMGIVSFGAYFKFYLQNGVSRRTFFFSSCISFFTVTVVVKLIDTLLMAVSSALGRLGKNAAWVMMIYDSNNRYQGSFSAKYFFESFLINVSIGIVLMLLGFMICIIFYRLSKIMKAIIACVVGGGLFILLPILNAVLFDGGIGKGLMNALRFISGASNGYNPYYLVCASMLIAVVFASLNYLLMRRAVPKE